MKKLSALMLLLALVLSMAACSSSTPGREAQLREQYPKFFDLPTEKGLEVFVWQMAAGSYDFCILPGTNRIMNLSDIQQSHTCHSIEDVKDVLAYYGLPDDSITVYAYSVGYSSYAYTVDEAYLEALSAMFDDCYQVIKYTDAEDFK